MNWNKFGLFKLPNQHKRFEYVPRYYNADKEVLQDKIDRAKKENTVDDEGKFAREIKFRSKMEDKWGADVQAQRRSSNIRLIVILGIIIIAFYYVFVGLDGLGYLIDTNLDKMK
ncbi:MAG: hypothetical protein GQ574_26410 [Crocinitomix sp.]|nr:hypothetical protein [Crocinitomix sp.]